MEATAKRNIQSGREYDSLIPKPIGDDVLIKGRAGVEDTVAFIRHKVVPQTLTDTEKLCKQVLKGSSLEDTLVKVWTFVYAHIPYKRDKEGEEQVRRPSRSWHDRNLIDQDGKAGVDCDCYSVFISSCLSNLGIPHKLRIAKYKKPSGETPYWQHIYVVVPKDGKLNHALDHSKDYYTLDCVKEEFDSQEPYLEKKDYKMELHYLNGLDGVTGSYKVPQSVDAQDLVSVHGTQEMAQISGWEKTDIYGLDSLDSLDGRRKSFGQRFRERMKMLRDKRAAFGQKLRDKLKKFGKKFGKFFNRYLNGGAIAIRNSILLGLKMDMFKISTRVKYAYLSDAQAKAKEISMDQLSSVRKIRDKIENIYEKLGGDKRSVQKAILNGRGNKDHAVPLNLSGLGALEEYKDEQERFLVQTSPEVLQEMMGIENLADLEELLSMDGLDEIGELSELHGLGSAELFGDLGGFGDFGDLGEHELGVVQFAAIGVMLATAAKFLSPISKALKGVTGLFKKKDSAQAQAFNQASSANTTDMPNVTQADVSDVQQVTRVERASNPTLAAQGQAEDAKDAGDPSSNSTSGFMGWVKENPGKTALGVGVLALAGYVLLRKKRQNKKPGNSLSGISAKTVRKNNTTKHHSKKRKTIKAVKLSA